MLELSRYECILYNWTMQAGGFNSRHCFRFGHRDRNKRNVSGFLFHFNVVRRWILYVINRS
jgi:hypothetical protein